MAVRIAGNGQHISSIIIPPPIHTFTSTNPSTNSPTYHIVYDLTLPQPSVDSSPFIPIDSNKNATLAFTQVNQNPVLSYTSYFPDTNPIQESSAPAWDGYVARLLGSGLNINKRDSRRNKFNRKLSPAITQVQTTLSSTVNGETDNNLKIHFSGSSGAKQPDRLRAGINSDSNSFIGGFTHNNINTRKTDDAGRLHKTVRPNISEKYVVKTKSVDTATISTSLPSCPLSLRGQSLRNTRQQDIVSSHLRLSKANIRSGDKCRLGSNCLNGVTSDTVGKTKLASNGNVDSGSCGLTVKDIVSVWNNVNSCARECNFDLTQNNLSSIKSKLATNSLDEKSEGETSDTKNEKQVIFKRDGDCVRLFVVTNGNQSDSYLLNSDNKAQNTTQAYVSEHPCDLSSLSVYGDSLCLLNSHSNGSLKVNSRCHTDDGKPSTKLSAFVKSVGQSINNSNTHRARESKVGRKAINRCNRVECRTPQPHHHTGVSGNEGTSLAITTSANITTALDNRTVLHRGVPLCSADVGGYGDRVQGAGHSTWELNNTSRLVNRDLSDSNLIGFGGKRDSEQAVRGSRVELSSGSFISSPLYNYPISDTNIVRKDVVDINKYIIQPLEGGSSDNTLRQRLDCILQGDDDRAVLRETVKTTRQQDYTFENDVPFSLDILDEVWQPLTPLQAKDNNHCKQARSNRTSITTPPAGGLVEKDDLNWPLINLDKHSVYRNTTEEDSTLHTNESDLGSRGRIALVNNISSLCGDRFYTSSVCPLTKEAFSKSQTDRCNLSGSLQCRSSAQSSNIIHPQVTTSERHRLLNVCSATTKQSWLKHNVLIQNSGELEYNISVPSLKTCSGEFLHSGNSRQKKTKITPRWKRDIPHNPVAEKIATFSQLNRNVTGHTLKSRTENKDSSSENCLPIAAVSDLTLAQNKESPRARFERNRAARACVIASNSGYIHEKLKKYSEDLEKDNLGHSDPVDCDLKDTHIVATSSTSLKYLPPITKQTSRNGCQNLGLHLNRERSLKTNERDTISRSSSDLKDERITSRSIFEVGHGILLSQNQHTLECGYVNNSGLIDQSSTSGIWSVTSNEQPRFLEKRFRPNTNSTVLNSNQSRVNIDIIPLPGCEKLPGNSYGQVDRYSSTRVFDEINLGNSNSIRDRSRDINDFIKLHPLFHLHDHNKVHNYFTSVVPFVTEDDKRNDGTSRVSKMVRRSVPTKSPENNQQFSTLNDISASFVSSSDWSSDTSSAVGRIYLGENYNTTNSCEFEVNKSRVCVIPLATRAQNSKLKAVGKQEIKNESPIHHEYIDEDIKATTENLAYTNIHSGDQSRHSLTDFHEIYGRQDTTQLKSNKLDSQSSNIDLYIDDSAHHQHPNICGSENCKRVLQQKQCLECPKIFSCNSSHIDNVSSVSDSSFTEKVPGQALGASSVRLSRDASSSPGHRVSTNCSNSFAQEIYSAEADMLASKGLRISDSGEDFITMLSPARSPYFKSSSSPHFQLEGTSYLILPTVVESLSTAASSNNRISTANNKELLTHRSISDSGVPIRQSDCLLDSDEGSDVFNDNYHEENENNSECQARFPRRNRLNCNHRSMSVDVLCTDNNSGSRWNNAPDHPDNSGNANQDGGRGYVEWKMCSTWLHKGETGLLAGRDSRGYVESKTCSTWLHKGETGLLAGRDSRGYVEWDTIWTTAAPWLLEKKDDEHVYDDVGVVNVSYSCDKCPAGSSPGSSVSVSLETPPALPERTYISRLRNNSNNNKNNGLSSPSSHKHRSNHHSHLHHDETNNFRKHHHHHHHHHGHRNNKNRSEHPSPSSSSATPPTRNSTTSSLPVNSKQHEHTQQSTKSLPDRTTKQDVSDESQNYAQVNKLRGYKFSDLIAVSDPPLPHRLDKSAIYSENYWHLASVPSSDNVTTWQTGDVLDYIDGLHESMSPKRRENIYILLNNKQTRAKFSESLEIESRLLSKGLISGSSANKTMFNKVDSPETACQGNGKDVVNSGIIKRRGATAPVSSTYV